MRAREKHSGVVEFEFQRETVTEREGETLTH